MHLRVEKLHGSVVSLGTELSGCSELELIRAGWRPVGQSIYSPPVCWSVTVYSPQMNDEESSAAKAVISVTSCLPETHL